MHQLHQSRKELWQIWSKKVIIKLPKRPPNQETETLSVLSVKGFGHIASQCPYQQTMLVLPNGEVIINEKDEYKGMPPLIEKDDEEEIEK